MLGYSRLNRTAALLAATGLLCLAAFGVVLTQGAYVHDDSWIVGQNTLLDAGAAGAHALMTTGYWEAVQGASARVHEYRPLLMLSFLFQRLMTGRAAEPMHAVNLALHALTCGLVFLIFRRKLPFAAAAAGTLFFAVLPTHTEAIAALAGRSELLTAALLLSSWLLLEGSPKASGRAAGIAFFTLALYVKEHALLFPLFLALSDWTFEGVRPWSRRRRGVYTALLTAIAVYLLLRLLVLKIPFGGGEPYFADRLTAALTVGRFAFTRYLWPSLSGFGLCPDFSRPLIPDARPDAAGSWPPLLILGGVYGAAIVCLLRKKAPWAFWLCAPSIFLLPTLHILTPLDTIGAQRFLYLPTIGLAAGLGVIWARGWAARPRAALAVGAALLAWQAWTCRSLARTWSGGLPYYEMVLSCNPVSARARAAYGSELFSVGRFADGEAQLREAVRITPGLALPYYNLARRAWDQGRASEAESLIAQSLSRDPGATDAWILSGLIAQSRGRADEATDKLRRALSLTPWSPIANFNLARLELSAGRPESSIPHWRAFARYAPQDPDAARAAAIADALESRRAASR